MKLGPTQMRLNNNKATYSTVLAFTSSSAYDGKPLVSYVMENDDPENPNKYCISESDIPVYENIQSLSRLSRTWNPLGVTVLEYFVHIGKSVRATPKNVFELMTQASGHQAKAAKE